jgi:hypothetical protein
MQNELLETVQRELEKYGIKSRIEMGGKHPKITWVAKGENRVYVTSGTTSDVRARLNARAHVRRMIREDGLEKPAVFSKPPVLLRGEINESPRQKNLQDQVSELRAEVEALIELILDQQPPSIDMTMSINGVRLVIGQPTKVAPPPPRTGKGQQVLDALDFSSTKSVPDLARELHMKYNNVAGLLSHLKKQGQVENLGRGQWRKKPLINGHG